MTCFKKIIFLVVLGILIPCAAVYAAPTTVDSSVFATNTSHSGSSSTVLILSDLVRYVFYRDSGGSCVYSKTTNGATSWGAAVTVDSQTDCGGIGIWYDRWSPGDTTGNYVHIVTWDTGSNDLWYTRLDTGNSDTLTTTVATSASPGSVQGGAFSSSTNYGSITKGTDGVLYVGMIDNNDSFVLKCSTTCTTASNWTEAGTSPFTNADDYLLLMPLASGNIMAIDWKVASNIIQSKVYTSSSSTWAASWTSIDSSAKTNTTYDAAFGATVDKLTNNIYLAYGADINTLGTDDDVRTTVYNGTSWTSKTDVLTNDTKGITGVKIALDENTRDIYVVYTGRTTSGTSTTGNVYTKKSSDGMVTWGSESSTINTTAADIYGARVNIMSSERIYATWWASSTIIGNTVADLTPPTVAFTSSTGTGSEGTTSVNLGLTLSSASIQTVTVDYAVTGTATGSGTDYTLASGTATITAGATTANISMTVVDDALDEADETVIVTISNPTNSSLGTNTTDTYTITDNDAAPTVAWTSSAQSSVAESGTLTVTAQLSAISGQAVTVPFTVTGTATSGTDYSITASPISISAGATTGTATITITSDTVDEANETVIVTMGTPTNATAGSTTVHTATITDDDSAPSVFFTSSSQSSSGESGTMTVTAQLSAVSGQDVSVPFTVTGTATSGTDYTITSSPISISAGSTTGTATITITSDTVDEADETVIVTMGTPTNATAGATTVHTATITDDDAAPTVSWTSSSQSSVSESGTLTVTAQLSTVSGQTVTIPFTLSGSATSGTDYSVTATPLTISAGSTTAAATITITADSVSEGNETAILTMGTPTNATAGSTTTHTATITDDDTVGVTIAESGGSTNVTEGSATADTYTLVLTSQPTSDVTVTLTSDAQVSVGSTTTLTFTSANWNTLQTVSVTAVDDSVAEGSHTGTITHTVVSSDTNYNGISVSSVTANVTDNDTAGVSVTESSGSTAVTEGGATDTYTVVLTSQPTSNVTLTLNSGTQLTTSSTTLTFTSGTWNIAQTVTVTAVDDSVAEGSHSGTVTHTAASSDSNYSGISINTISATITDNDTAGVSVTESSGSTAVAEGGVSDTYSLVLTSQPTSDVVVTLNTGAQLSALSTTLTFTSSNWNSAQVITVSAVDDSVAEGNHAGTITHTVVSSDPNYNGISVSNLTATITDNDSAGVTLAESGGSTNVTEGSATPDTYTVVLNSQPTSGVDINLSADSQVNISASTLTFTTSNWNTPQTVSVTAVDDSIAEGSHSGVITHLVSSSDSTYSALSVASVTAQVTDNDTAGVSVSESSGSTTVTEAGTTDTYTMVLTSQPTSNVMVTLSADAQIMTSASSLTFTSSNWNTLQTVTVTAVDDSVAEGTHSGVITHSSSSSDPNYNALSVSSVTAQITDNDSAGVSVAESGGGTTVTEGGATDTYTVVLTSQPTAQVNIALDAGSQLTSSLSTVSFTTSNWNTPQTITVTAVDDSIAEGNHNGTITHVATSSDANYSGISVNAVSASITDNDSAGVSVTESGSATNVTEGGSTDTYTMVLTSQPTNSVTVTINVDAQVTVGVSTLTFTTSNWNTPQTMTVTAVDDSLVEGNHNGTITHTATSSDSNYNGISINNITAAITDNDTAGVSVTESGGSTSVTEGSTTDTYSVVLTSQPVSDVVVTLNTGAQLSASSTTLTFTSSNWNSAQTVTVSAVDDSIAQGTHSATVTHTVSSSDSLYDNIGVASVTVSISDQDSASVSVVESGGTTSVVEGETSDTYTVVLTSQPLVDVVVMLQSDSSLTATPSLLTFTSSNWNSAQVVTVSAVDDTTVNGTRSSTITHSVSSLDVVYNSLSVSSVIVQITDNDTDSTTSSGSTTDSTTGSGGSGSSTTSTPTPLVATPLVADAGQDITMLSGDSATLDGTASTGDGLSYQWIITSDNGSLIQATLENETTSTPTFNAPLNSSLSDVTVTLVVTDSSGDDATDEMVLHILPATVSSQVVDQPLVGFVGEGSLFEVSSTTGGNITTSLVLNDAVMELPTDCGHYAFAMTRSRHLAIGCPDTDNSKGIVFISLDVVDNLSGVIDLSLSQDPFISISGQNDNNQLGKYITTGDVNGDGNDDIMAGAPGAGTDGEIYIIDVDNTVRAVLTGTSTIRLTSVLSADFLSAGAEDLFFGPDNEALNQNLRRQSPVSIDAMISTAYMLQGDISAGSIVPDSNTIDASIGDTNISDNGIDTAQSTQSTQNLFQSVAMGDLNDDGNSDVALAANDGLVYIFFGPLGISSRLNPLDADVLISEGDGLDSFGRMMVIGDVTGDRIGDLVVGAADYGSDGRGGVFVLFGRNHWGVSYDLTTTSSTDFLLIPGSDAGDGIGSDLILADTDSDQVKEIYTIKGLNSVYQISLTNAASFSGAPSATSSGGGGSSESAAGATNSFGCDLNPQVTQVSVITLWLMLGLAPMGLWFGVMLGMRKKEVLNWFFIFFCCVVSLVAVDAQASPSAHFSILYYRPAIGPTDYKMTLGSSTLPLHQWNFSSEFDYGFHPLELSQNGKRTQGVVDHLLIQHFSTSYTPIDGIQLDCDLPVVWFEKLGGGDTVTSMGEIYLRTRVRLLDSKEHFFGLAVAPFGTIQTGEANHYLSDHGPTLGILAAVDKDINSLLSVGLNMGADGRRHVVFQDLRSASRFWLSGGARVKAGSHFVFKGDLTSNSPFSNLFDNKVGSPTELLLDIDYKIGKTGWKANVGGGLSVVRGAGEPLFRTLAGLSYQFKNSY